VIFDHIGLVVPDLETGENFISKIFPINKFSPVVNDKNLGVKIQFCYDKSQICYELIAPYGVDNPISISLSENKNLINHIAYKTKNFNKTNHMLRNQGCIPLGTPKPAKAFENKLVIFYLTPLKFIIEIIEN
tara:strand:+ start:233 stop:628 length:396 start_codon:yes stop_codon:yes gene_type:complete